MAVKKRCMFCHKHTRADGTCQTEGCPLYVPEVKEEQPQTAPEPAEEQAEESVTDTNVGGKE